MPTNPLELIRKNRSEKDTGLDQLKKKYAEAKTAQVRYLSVWELNRAFYSGDQWVYLLE